MDISDIMERGIISNNNKTMNNVTTDVTFLSLALGDFSVATTQLINHDYYVAGGLALLGVLLVYMYHKFCSQPIPPSNVVVTPLNTTTTITSTPTGTV